MRGPERNSLPTPPTAAIESGVFVDGFRVERVIATRPDAYTLLEAEAPDGERVALTLLGPALTSDRELRRTVLELAKLRASIEHPHLLAFRGAVESGGRVYLLSAVPGPRTLADLLANGRPEIAPVLAVLGQVAGALETAAARGLTYRNLTPGAIVLKEDSRGLRGLLADFGIVCPPARGCDLLALGEGIESRSPEELQGKAPTPESNVYSLACILVRCLTGTPAYPYERPLLTLHAHMVESPPRVSERRRSLPPAVDAVVARGMAKDPSERFSSPAQLIRAAGQALGLEVAVPVVAAPPTERRQARARARGGLARGARRTTAWIGLALVASAVSGFATAGVDWSAEQRPAPAARSAGASDQAQRDAYTQRVTSTVERLRTRRVAARGRLRDARRPSGQAAAAGALASAYGEARGTLPDPPARGNRGPPLDDDLRKAERAYRKLATAAGRRSRRAWRIAAKEALRREAALQRALRRLRPS